MNSTGKDTPTGFRPQQFGLQAGGIGRRLELQALRSNAGWYLGTFDDEGPCSRESAEYFPTEQAANAALDSGDWTQRYEEVGFVHAHAREGVRP